MTAVCLHSFAGLYARVLGTLDHLLVKGSEHAASIGAGEAEMLDWRLIDDMMPIGFQAMVVINFTQQWPARVCGLPVPEGIGADLSLAEFRTEIAKAKAFLASLTPEQFAGRDDIALKHLIGNGFEPTMPLGQWLSVFATTNIYFHLSTAYGILRSRGTPIGKVDLFAGGL